MSNTDGIKDLDDGQRGVLRKIETLLRVADKGKGSADQATANEAASAAAKAQELLLAYNLSEDMLGQGSEDGRREEQKLRGGFYQYQRDLWEGVAELNFCLHFMSGGYKRWTTNSRRPDGSRYERKWEKWEQRHRLIGRKVNVMATINMATYLQEAIERLVTERLGDDPNANVARWSSRNVAFRNGATEVIVHKLYLRRKELVAEEQQKAREAQENAARAAGAGVSTNTALTIASYTQTEDDLNWDIAKGLEPGTTARQRAERAAKRAAEAEARRVAQEAYTKWAAENPEEARAQEEKARKEDEARERRNAARRTGGGYNGWTEKDRRDHANRDAFEAGRQAGKAISLDQQMGGGSKGSLGNG